MKIGLGTVQFGLNYGISNRDGRTPEQEVAAILEYAWESGIKILDTAPAYGSSEAVLGRTLSKQWAFEIVTKTPVWRKEEINGKDAICLKKRFRDSLGKLNRSSIYGLLIHHAADLLSEGGEYLWDVMEALKAEGGVRKIGASVYSPADLDELVERYPLDLVQLPLNIFDQRMIQSGELKNLKNRGIEIHSRSVFLQGLLLMSPDELPAHFNAVKMHIANYRDDLKKRGISPIKAALSFINRQEEIDNVIIGVNHQNHLREIIATYHDADGLDEFDFSRYAIADESVINPSLWNKSQ